ncbi:hypothetical protein L873DRAFT_45889 [Choiromyces venosus 120613-1]|uniref:Uncharacterized protein n=1 Tax=Choiromyces venosus 120613-1 TaxID=1336337 RepID=A0A3N4K055_9PEZI|nr:hypothetical protein L873DRAFT_45889 [Choiromyces venosus 120613-1]
MSVQVHSCSSSRHQCSVRRSLYGDAAELHTRYLRLSPTRHSSTHRIATSGLANSDDDGHKAMHENIRTEGNIHYRSFVSALLPRSPTSPDASPLLPQLDWAYEPRLKNMYCPATGHPTRIIENPRESNMPVEFRYGFYSLIIVPHHFDPASLRTCEVCVGRFPGINLIPVVGVYS